MSDDREWCAATHAYRAAGMSEPEIHALARLVAAYETAAASWVAVQTEDLRSVVAAVDRMVTM